MKIQILLSMLLVCSFILVCQTKEVNGRKAHQLTRLRKTLSKKDCNPQEVLLAIDDMYITQEDLEDTEEFKRTVFDSKAIYEEVITQELTEIFEYYNLRGLQTDLQVDSKYNADLTLSEVYIRKLYNSFGKKSTMLAIQGQIDLQSFKLYVMRQQIYSTIKMVSMINAFDYTLRYNNLNYEVVTVSQRFFQIATEYIRLAQIDRLFGKGVLLQISDQINQLIFSNVADSNTKDDDVQKELNNLQMAYITRINNEVDTLQLQMTELDLVQRIQYQYDIYALDTEALFSKDAMKVISQTLSELIFKDIKINYDLATALKNQQDEVKFVFATEPDATEILEITSWDILNVQKTTQNIDSIKDYASYLMTQTHLDAKESNLFYDTENFNKFMEMASMHKYEMTKLSEDNDKNIYIQNVVGIEDVDIRSIQLTLYTISDFLEKMNEVSVFPEEIRQLMNFEDGFVMDKMVYPTLASLVHLRQGYDRFIQTARNLDVVTAKYGNQLIDKLEYIELINLMTKQIKNQQIITNQKFKLLKYELFQDLMSIVVEVRNYAILYQNAVLTVQPFYPKVCKKAFNEQVLLKLQEISQEDVQRFQERFRYVLNNFFVRQVNVIATVKGLTELMVNKAIKLFYAVEIIVKKLQASEKSKDRIEYLYQYKIESTALWKQNILYKQAQSLNKVYVRFMLRRYKPYNENVQKYIGSPFTDFMNAFNNGQVSKQDIFRLDNVLMGNNGLELEQVGNRVSLLYLMQKHKCSLIQIYKEFQIELLAKQSKLVKTQINYQNLISRVRQAFYLYVSDIEVVPVDVTSENYFNTINQLKVMGYDEFILQSYTGSNVLLKQLMTYKQTVDAINVDQAFRLFYCQGCFNRIVDSIQIYEYSQYNYKSLMLEVNKKVEELKTTTSIQYFSEVNVVTYFNQVKQTENVVYMVKFYSYANKFQIVYSKSEHKSTHYLTQEKVKTTWLSGSAEDENIQSITINLHCVLDRFALMLKKFSIYSQNIILKTQNVIDQMGVKNIIDTFDQTVVEKNDMLNKNFINTFTETMRRDYENYVKKYDTWSYDYDYKYGKYILQNINSIVKDNDYSAQGYTGAKYFVFTNRKLVYQNYINLAWTELLANQLTQETSAVYAQFLDKNLIQDCIQFHQPECLIGQKLSKEYQEFAMPEAVQVAIVPDDQRQIANTLFKNEYWRIGQSNELGKIFSRVINLMPNYVLKEQSFLGKLIMEKKFTDWSEYSKYIAEQSATSLSNILNGMNNNNVGIYTINEQNTLSVKLYTVPAQNLNFQFNSFSLYNDDIRYNIVQDMLKAAFMFPYRLTNENIRDNNVNFISAEQDFTEAIQARINNIQLKMNEVFSDNDYYGVYIGTMEEAIEKNQLVRIYVEKDATTNCLSHNIGVVEPSDEDNYSDIIDNDYVVNEVVYYFDQERKEQYFQDMLAINYNDPFYRVLYSLGFRAVTANEPDNDSIHAFYDFSPKYNQQTNEDLSCKADLGFEWLEKMPPRALKRMWVRPQQICAEQTINNEGEYFLTSCLSSIEKQDLKTRQANYIKDIPVLTKKVVMIVNKQMTEQEFIDITWNGMFRSLKNILLEAAQYLKLKMTNPNVYLIQDYNAEIQSVAPETSGRGQMILLSHFFRFTRAVIQKQTTFFSNKAQEKIGTTNLGSLVNQVATVRPLEIYQFDANLILVEPVKESQCALIENNQPGCLGMTSPIFSGFAGDMEKQWLQKQIVVYGICGASYSGFLNYAMYQYALALFAFNVNTCNRGQEIPLALDSTPQVSQDEAKDSKTENRLQKNHANHAKILASLSSGKFNLKKAQQVHEQQQKRLLKKKTKHSLKLEHLQVKKTNKSKKLKQ